jgi:hypothetical protein
MPDDTQTDIQLIGIQGAPTYMGGTVKINGVAVAAESIRVSGFATGDTRAEDADPVVTVTLKLIPSSLVFSEPEPEAGESGA